MAGLSSHFFKSYSRTFGYSRGFRPSKGLGSYEREITEFGREITFEYFLKTAGCIENACRRCNYEKHENFFLAYPTENLPFIPSISRIMLLSSTFA